MKDFEAPEYTHESISRFLKEKIQTEGVFKKKALETLERIEVINRPFRKISFELENLSSSESKTSISFVDEQFSPFVTDDDHRFLLWRPRYGNLGVSELIEEKTAEIMMDNSESIQTVIDNLMLHRWNGQELDDELRPKLRSLQANPLSAIALIIPRSPHGLQREEQILVERKEVHSFVLASLLVTNCSPKDIIISADIGERVYARTIVAEYRNLSNGNLRLLLLETPGTSSLQDAHKSGQASTRVCFLYRECKELLQKEA